MQFKINTYIKKYSIIFTFFSKDNKQKAVVQQLTHWMPKGSFLPLLLMLMTRSEDPCASHALLHNNLCEFCELIYFQPPST